MEQKKRALITGSSRGIGRAIALALAKDGFEVLIHCANTIEKAEQVRKEIEDRGGSAGVIHADLSNPKETARLAEEMGEIDVLILNASVQIKKHWDKITVEEAEKQMQCNYISSLQLIQAAVPHMKKAGWGRIVTVGSVQEVKPHPDMLVYSASKASQTNTVRSLSVQLAGYGITVNNLAPGVIYTDRNMEALADPVYAEKVTQSIPCGFYGTPEDCTGAVRLLCSDAGRYITGQSLYVDGGKSVQ